jgi:hypothetical protein
MLRLYLPLKADCDIVEGAETFWLSPIYKSPMADFGYDISGRRAAKLNKNILSQKAQSIFFTFYVFRQISIIFFYLCLYDVTGEKQLTDLQQYRGSGIYSSYVQLAVSIYTSCTTSTYILKKLHNMSSLV